MIFVDLEEHHLSLIRPQQAQQHEVAYEGVKKPPGQGWTAVVDGLPICCGGLIRAWEGRAYAWALLDQDAGPHMVPLTRGIRSLLDRAGWRRIEMAVDAEFPEGARWARLLGFRHEVRARKFLANGNDADIFVRL